MLVLPDLEVKRTRPVARHPPPPPPRQPSPPRHSLRLCLRRRLLLVLLLIGVELGGVRREASRQGEEGLRRRLAWPLAAATGGAVVVLAIAVEDVGVAVVVGAAEAVGVGQQQLHPVVVLALAIEALLARRILGIWWRRMNAAGYLPRHQRLRGALPGADCRNPLAAMNAQPSIYGLRTAGSPTFHRRARRPCIDALRTAGEDLGDCGRGGITGEARIA